MAALRDDALVPGTARRRYLALAAVIALLGVSAGVFFLRASGVAPLPDPAGTPSIPVDGTSSPARELLPGRLLLAGDEGVYVIGDDIEDATELPEDLAGMELSPDGTRVLAARYQQEPTGITRDTELVAVDVTTGETTTLVTAGRKEDVAPAVWSPDGKQVAYRLTTYGRDPALEHPRGHGQRSALCVLSVENGTTQCFGDLGRVDGFAWSPDGRELIVDGALPLQVVDVRSGSTRAIGKPNDPWLRLIQTHGPFAGFVFPSWSPSGRYVAAVADTGLRRVVVFDRRGRLVAAGRPFRDFFTGSVWSPSRDVIAYVSVNGNIVQSRGLATEVRLLVVRTGREVVVRSFRSYPLVYGLEWDPSGELIAALLYDAGHEWLSIADVAERRWSRLSLRRSVTELLDWGP
ncbi:MAG: hypothetical protein ACRDGW_06725 [Actinomycetota bacterium]